MALEIGRAITARDFAGLDTLAQTYRTTGSHDSSGEENLHLFYRWVVFDLMESSRCSGCDDKGLDFAHDWIASRLKSAAAHIVLAELLVRRAFAVRGRGYADVVPPDVWPRVREINDGAWRDLLRSKPFAASDPEWYAALLELALLQQPDDRLVRSTFAEGSRKFPDYLPIFEAMSTYLLPEWNGDWQQIDAMAKEASRRSSPDAMGMYARIYRSIGNHCSCGHPLRDETAIDWSIMIKSMLAWSRRYPAYYNFSSFAHISCENEDYVSAQYYFEKKRIANGETGTVSCGVNAGRFHPT